MASADQGMTKSNANSSVSWLVAMGLVWILTMGSVNLAAAQSVGPDKPSSAPKPDAAVEEADGRQDGQTEGKAEGEAKKNDEEADEADGDDEDKEEAAEEDEDEDEDDEEEDEDEEDEDEEDEERSQTAFGSLSLVGAYARIGGDKGRFRENGSRQDGMTGGIEELTYDLRVEALRYELSLRAMDKADFDFVSKTSKDKLGYIKVRGQTFRHWYDGTSGHFATDAYELSPTLLEMPDEDLYVDRRKLAIELGLTMPDVPEIKLGYEHTKRKGKDVPFWGAAAGWSVPFVGGFPPRQRKLPVVRRTESRSNMLYLDFEHTVKKVHFTVRQQLEDYDEEATIDEPAYVDKDLRERTSRRDQPSFRSSRTTFQVDSHVHERAYLSAGYMFDYVNNDSTYELSYLTPTGERKISGDNVGGDVGDTGISAADHFSRREKHVWTVGGVLDITEDLRLIARLRPEDSDTSSKSKAGEPSPLTIYPIVPEQHLTESRVEETALAEMLELSYSGIPRTVLSLQGEWEQRSIHVDERYRSIQAPARNRLHRADIDRDTAEYTGRATYLPFPGLRLSGQHRKSSLHHDYVSKGRAGPAILVGSDVVFGYPGYLYDRGVSEEETVLSARWRLNRFATLVPKVAHIRREIEVHKESPDDISNARINRYSLGLDLAPFPNLYLTTVYTYDDVRIATEADKIDPQNPPIAQIPNYRVDVYSLATNATLALNEKISLTAGYHRVHSGGAIETVRDEVSGGLRYQVSPKVFATVKFIHYDFDDDRVGRLDNYSGNAIVFGLRAKL